MVRSNTLRKVTLTLAILLTATALFAQYTAGPRIGINLANLRGSSVENNKMTIGYNVGGFVNYSLEDVLTGELADIMSVQAELSVQTKGTKFDFPGVDDEMQPVTKSVKQSFTYVQVPVLAKFSFETNNDLGYFGEAGFFMSSLFGLTIDGEKSWDHDGDPNTDRRKYREEYAGFDLGAVIGGGVTYPLPIGSQSNPLVGYANVRYGLGLANIGEPKKNTPEVLKEMVEDVKTNTLSILLGVAFKF